MANKGENNIKLGVFVLAGLLVLMASFYMIGKNRNIFGSGFELKARFNNLNGLMEGNNVLFSGIQAGTVKKITMINDTLIEVTLAIDNKTSAFIHKNALAAIGTEGLMGNKVVNIQAKRGTSPMVETGDILAAQKMINTDEMLLTLSKTNNNIATISESLKNAVLGIDSSALVKLLNDQRIGTSLRSSLKSINQASVNADNMTRGLNDMIVQIKQGKGAAGVLISDPAVAGDLKTAISNIRSSTEHANQMTRQLQEIVQNVNHDLSNGKGPLHGLLRDSTMTKKISLSLDNVQKGTDGFNQNMEALKHNFFFKGYFKNLAKQQKKDSLASTGK
ncbi:phospholipid/cholesterol/gamma-HCH transport system substrate-binding protein [Mucilaginibacter sp. UYP25]|uniref:MlaD family protein n=1 Tax=unclassified Mucilaginibacter TaxID=2617802 RepID=UPI0033914BBE